MNDTINLEPPEALRRFKPYRAYKDSGIEWLRKIPAHWEVRRLRSTVTSCENGVWGDEPDGVHDLPCVRVADFDRVTFSVVASIPTLRAIKPAVAAVRVLHAGDLLLEKSGGGENQPVGAVVLFDHSVRAVCSNFVARMTTADGYDARYLTYLHATLYALRINTRHIKQNTGIQNLDSSSYLTEATGLPPYLEQCAIAAFLDRETARIDALVAKKERLIELLQEKRSALITRAVTKGLNPSAPMKTSDVDWLGQVPAHWGMKPLGQILLRITYGFTNPMPVADEGPYMLTAFDIGDGEILYENARRTTEEAFQRLLTDKSKPRAGDVLITKDGTLGRVAVAGAAPICINQSVALLRFDQAAVDIGFVQNALRAGPYQDRMVLEAGGTAIKHIYVSRLAKMPIAIPPPMEQLQIARFISDQANAMVQLERRVREGIDSLNELRISVISAAVTGKIDVGEEAA